MRDALTPRSDPHTREVLRGTIVAFATKLVGVGTAFLFNVLIARTLGPAATGNYFLAVTITLVATVFARAGLDNTLLRFIAAAGADGDWSRARGVYASGMRLALATSVLASVVMFLCSPVLATQFFSKPELTPALRLMALAVVPSSLLILHSETLKALKRVMLSLAVHGFILPAVGIAVLLALSPGRTANDAALAHTVGAAAAALAGFAAWKWFTRGIAAPSERAPLRALLESSVPLFLFTSLGLVMGWAGTFLLGVWRTSAEVGIFTVAARTALLAGLLLVAANTVAAPKFAELYHRGDLAALERVARKTAALAVVLTSPVFVAFLVAPGFFMELFGMEFGRGGPVLAVLTVGQIVNVACGSVGYVLMMSGRERPVRNAMAVAALVNILLNLVLIPIWGMMGAAVAATVSLATLNLGWTYLVWSELGISTIPFFPAYRPEAAPAQPVR